MNSDQRVMILANAIRRALDAIQKREYEGSLSDEITLTEAEDILTGAMTEAELEL